MLRTALHTLWSRKRRLLATTTAVVLGVAFLVATLVLGDTTKAGFSDAFTSANAGIDVVVRDSHSLGGADNRQRALVPESHAAEIADAVGVAAVAPQVTGTAQLVDAEGDPVGGDGPPTIGANWIDDPALSSLHLVDGRAPGHVAADEPVEIVIDVASADKADLAIGDTTSVLTPKPVAAVVVGTSRYGDADSFGGATFVSFHIDVAQELLTGRDDHVSAFLVRAAEGVSADELQVAVDVALPIGSGLEAITGAELTAEQQADIDDDFLDMFRSMLLVFAAISVVVAAFSIHNTFSILVAQRTRESALLRAIGASRAQVVGGLAIEALVVGVLATAIGFAVGTGLAAGLSALMESSLEMPPADLVVTAGAVLAAIVVGVGTTIVASIGPAIRAARVAPLEALRAVAVDGSAVSKLRAIAGVLLCGAGVAWLVTATSAGDNALARAGLGALALLVGFVVVGPVAARPAAAVLGVVPAGLRGITGRLARRNAMRNPRRVAACASALMVGTAVVGLFTTFGASLERTITDTVRDDFAGDLVVIPDGWSGALLSPELPAAIGDLDDVTTAVGANFVPAEVNGDTVEIVGTDAAALGAVFDVGVTSGSLAGFGDGDVAVSEMYAEEHDLRVGSPLGVSYADRTTSRLSVAAVYEDRFTFGDVLVAENEVAAHLFQPQFDVVLVDLAEGVDLAAGKAAVAAVTDRLGAPAPMDSDEYRDTVSEEIDGMLFFVYAMLGVAVLIAVIGVGNTLSLSIHERTRELGVLRAVGQERAQVRSSVRWESAIIAVFGTLGGLGLGAFGGWAVMGALETQEGFGSFALPVGQLAVVLGLAVVAGVVAAVRPARRAARTDILAAIASD